MSRSEINEAVENVAEEQDVDLENLDKSDIELMNTELGLEFFPNTDPEDSPTEKTKAELFEQCMESKWARNWEQSLSDDESAKSQLINKADACYSTVADAEPPLFILPFTTP
jgi:hypothetical protein